MPLSRESKDKENSQPIKVLHSREVLSQGCLPVTASLEKLRGLEGFVRLEGSVLVEGL